MELHRRHTDRQRRPRAVGWRRPLHDRQQQRADLTLVKVVDNGTTGATATAADWTLSATGPTPFSGTANTPAVTSIPVKVGAYTLTESGGPAGYTASGWTCTGTPVTVGTVTIALATHATCTITNTAVAPRLTLVKTVTDDNGAGAVPTDWLLSATGPTTIQGATGGATVTNAEVKVGDYVLAESGPTGFTASQWSCTGATATAPALASITLAAGDQATCTIHNDDQPAKLTLRKIVDAAESGSGKVPADWTLTATPATIPGQGVVSGNGDPASAGGVDQVTVFSGTYHFDESGPPGFDSGTWICQGTPVTADGQTTCPPVGT